MPNRFHSALLAARPLLEHYRAGRTFADEAGAEGLEQALFLHVRSRHHRLPDPLLKAAREAAFLEEKRFRLSGWLLRALQELATEYLDLRGGRVFVLGERYADWQDALLELSPAMLITARVFLEFKGRTGRSFDQARGLLAAALQHSTLPCVHDPRLDDIIRAHGLHELHMHLNGTTEADFFWQYALCRPDKVVEELTKGWRERRIVREFYAQHGLPDVFTVKRLLHLARWARDRLARVVMGWTCAPKKCSTTACSAHASHDSLFRFRQMLCDPYAPFSPPGLLFYGLRHPLAGILPAEAQNLAVAEALLLYKTFEALDAGNAHAARLFHVYSLIQSVFIRLIVQQREQFGFDQFEKIAQVMLRDAQEDESYGPRFLQLRGMYGADMAYVEGRYSPKVSESKNRRAIARIIADATNARRQPEWVRTPVPNRETKSRQDFTVGVVAHFIKKSEELGGHKAGSCRASVLRHENRSIARALINTLQRGQTSRTTTDRAIQALCGIDAANNERYTPPEVYAPVYRLLRDNGFSSFTFHAGEDYAHLASGIRAVHEVLHFLELGPGDRIGHAVALGIDPRIWCERIGSTLYCARGEWLDTLVWMHSVLATPGQHGDKLFRLENRIAELYYAIYQRDPPALHVLRRAWEMRQLDALELSKLPAPKAFAPQRSELRRLLVERETHPQAFAEFERYHNHRFWERYNEKVKVSTERVTEDMLRTLQDIVVKECNTRHCLIEVMLTSNLRICPFEAYAEHHLFRWLRKGADGRPTPEFCLATDDPGIFSTNLRNEFAHALRTAESMDDFKGLDVYDLLTRCNERARAFRFLPTGPAGRKSSGQP